MTQVFTDASSAILLEKADLFEPLLTLFQIVMAPSVFEEITPTGYPGADFFSVLHKSSQILVSPLKNDGFDGCPQPGEMDKGERDTLCLFLEKKQGFILTDDGQAARYCRAHCLPFINALLVPKIFWYAGQMSQEDCFIRMKALCRIGRYSDTVRAFAFDCGPGDLSFFLGELG